MSGKYIQPYLVEDLLTRTDIVKIVGDRLPLKRSGSNWVALCPFHQEKTASFAVNQQRQIYHCFGCQAHGNAISFLMNFDHLDFVAAVEKLADLLGVRLPAEISEDTNKQRFRQRGLAIYQKIADYFRYALAHSPLAQAYLKKRGISSTIAKQFKIGYAPNSWVELERQMGQEWHWQELVDLGLYRRNASSPQPRFKNRLMFPICDRLGQIIAFGGRTLINHPAKYLNSPETALYHKSEVWYGLYEARTSGREEELLVVEGYLDVLALAQYGLKNVVASCGTAVSVPQLKSLLRQVSKVLFCFDGDAAGYRAAWQVVKRALPLAQEGEFNFLLLPAGEDPDSLIRQWGAQRFKNWSMEHRLSLDQMLIRGLSRQYDLHTVTGKYSFLQEALKYLALIPRGLFYQLMVQKLAEITSLDVNGLMAHDLGVNGLATNVPSVCNLPPRDAEVSGPSRLAPIYQLQKKRSPGAKAAVAAPVGRLGQKTRAPLPSLSPGHPLIMRLLEVVLAAPALANPLLAQRDLLVQFTGGEALSKLLRWLSQRDAPQETVAKNVPHAREVNAGLILEHLRGSLFAQVVNQATLTRLALLSPKELKNELTEIIEMMSAEIERRQIKELMQKLDKQQLSSQEKLVLQELIKKGKLKN